MIASLNITTAQFTKNPAANLQRDFSMKKSTIAVLSLLAYVMLLKNLR
jgi:hypothetical protein